MKVNNCGSWEEKYHVNKLVIDKTRKIILVIYSIVFFITVIVEEKKKVQKKLKSKNKMIITSVI